MVRSILYFCVECYENTYVGIKHLEGYEKRTTHNITTTATHKYVLLRF